MGDSALENKLTSEMTNKDSALRQELMNLAFDVYRTSEWKSNGIITYQGTGMNTFGTAINLWTGTFTAPEKGVYRFTFMGNFLSPSGQDGEGLIYLKKDGTTIATSYENPTSSDNYGRATISLNSITEMNAGQTVYV